MAYDHEYPYTDASKYNDDWVLSQVKKMEATLKEFININSIKYADPISWDITRQYEANTVVVDSLTGNAYLSVKPVPSGININNTEYWTEVFNYAKEVNDLMLQICPEDDGRSTTSSKDRNQGSLVWLNNKLIVMTKDILAGTAYIEATPEAGISGNFIYTTVNRQITASYNSDNKRLTICGTVDGNTQIVSHGDMHIYDGATQAIQIIEVP